jgi:NCAIR mutase (PurE)-related protein
MSVLTSLAGEIRFDFDRRRRTGLDETVFAQGKSSAQLEAIFELARASGAPLLITRLAADKHASLAGHWRECLDYCAVSETAYLGLEAAPPAGGSSDAAGARVAIVAAGTSDVRVAREAERTLFFNRVGTVTFFDVGVAGLWRLTQCVDQIGRFPVVIAVAGMDAALPTVLGGLIGSLIIAVPTSVGYGVATGGHTALHAILASCASGITCVNIDNGYGAACAALRALANTPSPAGPAPRSLNATS